MKYFGDGGYALTHVIFRLFPPPPPPSLVLDVENNIHFGTKGRRELKRRPKVMLDEEFESSRHLERGHEVPESNPGVVHEAREKLPTFAAPSEAEQQRQRPARASSEHPNTFAYKLAPERSGRVAFESLTWRHTATGSVDAGLRRLPTDAKDVSNSFHVRCSGPQEEKERRKRNEFGCGLPYSRVSNPNSSWIESV